MKLHKRGKSIQESRISFDAQWIITARKLMQYVPMSTQRHVFRRSADGTISLDITTDE